MKQKIPRRCSYCAFYKSEKRRAVCIKKEDIEKYQKIGCKFFKPTKAVIGILE